MQNYSARNKINLYRVIEASAFSEHLEVCKESTVNFSDFTM